MSADRAWVTQMQSRDMRKNKEISLACFLLILGIAVSLISGMIIIQSDRARLYYVMDESFDTIKSRIVRWNNYEVGDRTKSEVRLLDKAKELSRCLKAGGGLRCSLRAVCL